MSKKRNIIFSLSIVLFVLIELFLIKNNQFQVGIFFYLFYCLTLFFIEKRYIISFFVYQLPIAPLISTDYKLFGLVGPHEIIFGFSLFVLIQLAHGYKVKLNAFQKIAIQFTYFLFFISTYIITKDIISGLELDKSRGAMYIFKNTVRFFLYYYSLVLLIKIIYQKGIYSFIIPGIKMSLITLVLSMIFAKYLILIGAGAIEKNADDIVAGKGTRFLGLYGAGGDENSAGIFLAAIFGFFLSLYEKSGNIKEHILYFGFAVLGVLLTGSRTAFIALSLIILIFLITNKSGKAKFGILVTFIIFYFVFAEQLNLVIERFFDDSAVRAVDPNDKGRFGKWILYIEWILDNPETLIYGNQENIDYNRAPHNYLVFLLYHTGIVPFIIFLSLFYKVLKKIKVSFNKRTLKNVYYILPFPLIFMTVNSFGSSIYLWIYLPMGALLMLSEKRKSKS